MRDLAAWADEIGFAPAKDYVALERLFGDITADACQTTFQFGRARKPSYFRVYPILRRRPIAASKWSAPTLESAI
jgi:hypothetical protein